MVCEWKCVCLKEARIARCTMPSLHVIAMSLPCCCHVVAMSLPCRCHSLTTCHDYEYYHHVYYYNGLARSQVGECRPPCIAKSARRQTLFGRWARDARQQALAPTQG